MKDPPANIGDWDRLLPAQESSAKPGLTVRRDRIPSLRALRIFEVVGRHLNMQSASETLCITVSAVSHQIRYLEAELEVQLFRRTGRGLELTKDGEALLPGLTLVFEQLGATIERFRRRAGPQIVTISMSATFAMRWFLSRLTKFYETHPDIEIHVATHVGREVQRDASVDCFIHVGENDWPELEGELLFKERLGVACSPSIQCRPGLAIRCPKDVLKNRILRADERPDDWALWLQAMDVKMPRSQRTLAFQGHNLAIQAAIEGLGVILADPVEIAEELQAGRLLQPLESGLAIATRGHYFYSLVESDNAASVMKVREWLRQELGQELTPKA
jgi:LysR family transcriptional regulator, glycine cleavage system transcriptional activator